jgi:type VI secretion system secreted protein VgrG
MATQSTRVAGVKVDGMDDDVLVLRGMQGTEELGRLFRYELSLASDDHTIKADDILGKKVTVWLELADESKRFFSGLVSRFSQSGVSSTQALYQATIRPWLWFLTREADCRIFQEMTVPEIVQKVFDDNGFSDYELKLSGSYEPWVYCVQYRETDFNFVSRLLEQEGIYYFVKHEDGNHVLVLADHYGAHSPVSANESAPFNPTIDNIHSECISQLSTTHEVVTGVYSLRDYDFEKPSLDLTAQTKEQRQHDHADFEFYDYPGEYLTAGGGKAYTDTRIEEASCQHERVSGTGTVRGFTPGGLFNLTEFPRDDQNREYLLIATNHDLQPSAFETGSEGAGGPVCVCGFTAIDSKIPFRPARLTPKPVVQGPQTAVVVGPSGEEIYTDKHARVKVQFHWDREGNKDENSSCWIRVAQVWAGEGWGGIQIPRIGQEVMVEFLEGDPDQPIITGRVYNGEKQPPYPLPANMTQSGIKSRSTTGGGDGNFNEIRMEDKKGEEELYIHAEKDHTNITEHDRSEDVGHDRSLHVGNNKSETVDNNKSITVGAKHTESIGSDKSLTVSGNHTETIGSNMVINVATSLTEAVGVNYAEAVGVAMELAVGATYSQAIGASKTIRVGTTNDATIGGNQTEEVGGDVTEQYGKSHTTQVKEDRKLQVDKTFNMAVKEKTTIVLDKELELSAKSVKFTAQDELVVEVGSAKLTMSKNGDITLEGKAITIKGSGDVTIKGSKTAIN